MKHSNMIRFLVIIQLKVSTRNIIKLFDNELRQAYNAKEEYLIFDQGFKRRSQQIR